MSSIFRWAYGFFSAFSRSLTATFHPMCSGAPLRWMYARMNGANAPPAPSDAPLPLPSANWALPSDCFSNATASTRLVLAGLHVRRGDDAGRAADRAGGVHAEHRLAHRAERVGQVELRLHDALEEVGRLADHDGVDVGQRHVRVVERAEHGLADEPAERDVVATRLVVGLADADDRAGFSAHASSSRMQTRFCCRHGPDVEWASARFPPPKTWSAAYPMRPGRWP